MQSNMKVPTIILAILLILGGNTAAVASLPGLQTVTTSKTDPNVAPGRAFAHTSRCPSGKVAIGGGYSVDTPTTGIVVTVNGPSNSGTTWTIVVRNTATIAQSITAAVAVICVTD